VAVSALIDARMLVEVEAVAYKPGSGKPEGGKPEGGEPRNGEPGAGPS
jgi:hypothetical protein